MFCLPVFYVDEVHVVGAYASELEQKEFSRNIILGNSKGRYSAVAPADTSYPYADGTHGYGHTYAGGYA
jgi:hypothetical protein